MLDPFALDLLSALSEPIRLEIIEMLAISPDPLMVEMIAARIGRSQPIVSHHLSILRDAEVVDCVESGRCHFYSLTSDFLAGQLSKDPSGRLTLTIPFTKGGGR